MRMGYDEIRARHQALTAAFTAGTLTETMLDREVETVVEDPGDGPPESIGYGWIREHLTEFTAIVSDKTAFLRRHLDNQMFAALVILKPEVLNLLPEGEREPYVRDSIMRYGAWNQGWVLAALEASVQRSAVAKIVLDKLEATEAGMWSMNFLRHFMQYGAGYDYARGNRIDPTTEWGVLDDTQFIEALRICIRKAPITVLDARNRLANRLGPETLQAVLVAAADNLCVVAYPDVLATLPFETRFALAGRLGRIVPSGGSPEIVSMRFVVELTLEMWAAGKTAEAIAFFKERETIFEACSPAALYRVAASLLTEAGHRDGTIPVRTLLAWLERELDVQGYQFGVIEEGTRFNRRTNSSSRQMQVRSGRHNYVQCRHQHRYFPRVGDRVLFKPSQGRSLTSTVTAVTFIPLNPAQEY